MPQADGKVKHRPFHSYTMKQAIEEGFILDVLKHYTPVDSYYKLVKKIEDDPEFDTKRAKKKLRRYVESHDHAIRLKAEIMVDHFHEQVLALNKIGGEARAMVVTSGIERAIQYFHAIRDYLGERKSRYKAIVAFSGEHEYGGVEGDRGVAQRLSVEPDRRQDPGGPVPLPDLRRQVPDRLRRAAAAHDVRGQAALRHQGGADPVAPEPRAPAEARRLRARLHERLGHDPGGVRRLLPHDGAGRGDRPEQAARPQGGARRLPGLRDGAGRRARRAVPRRRGPRQARSDPRRLRGRLQGAARRGRPGGLQGQGQGVLRAYGFLSSILPYTNAEWEKLSIFLNFLVPKLPAPKEEDLSKGILEAIDMDSYRVEKKAAMKIQLPDADAEIEPVPTTRRRPQARARAGSALEHPQGVQRPVRQHPVDRRRPGAQADHRGHPEPRRRGHGLPERQAELDKQNARIEHDKALARVMTAVLKDDTELFKQFMDNESFKRWLTDTVFGLTYNNQGQAI